MIKVHFTNKKILAFFPIPERKCCRSIADCTVARLGNLRFRFCQWHSNVYVWHHERIVCTRWCCVTGIGRIRLWSWAVGMSRSLLSFRWSQGVVAIFAHRKSVSVERSGIFIHVCRDIPNDFVSVVEATSSVLEMTKLKWKFDSTHQTSK